jgi:hypothetical protein
MDQLSQSRQGFLQEGLRSYPDALIAVREFQNEIQERCRAILRRRVVELERALGLPSAPSQVKPYAWGNDPSKVNLRECVELGAQWQTAGLNNLYLGFYASLGWRSEDDIQIEHYASASLETDHKPLITAVLQRLEREGRQDFESHLTYGYMSLFETTSPDDPEACLGKVDTMVLKWITLWDEIGGLQAVIPRTSQT